MAAKAKQVQQTPAITINGQPAATLASVTGNTGLPANTGAPASGLATMANTLLGLAQAPAPTKQAASARLQAMQQAGIAAQGATALAHTNKGNAALGKLPAGSFAINPAKTSQPSKAGFNGLAWAAIVATGGGLPATLAAAVQAATGCSGTVAAAHVRYRHKQGWLMAV